HLIPHACTNPSRSTLVVTRLLSRSDYGLTGPGGIRFLRKYARCYRWRVLGAIFSSPLERTQVLGSHSARIHVHCWYFNGIFADTAVDGRKDMESVVRQNA